MFGAEEDVENDQRGADGDGGVGDVESGIVKAAEAEFEKVGDGAVEDAVGDVAGGSAEEERQTGGGHRATGVPGGEEPGKRGDDDDRAADEEDARPRRCGVGEDSERDAGIAAVDEIDEIVDELAVPAFVGLRFEPGFGRAIDDDDGERKPEPAKSSRDDQRFVLLALVADFYLKCSTALR